VSKHSQSKQGKHNGMLFDHNPQAQQETSRKCTTRSENAARRKDRDQAGNERKQYEMLSIRGHTVKSLSACKHAKGRRSAQTYARIAYASAQNEYEKRRCSVGDEQSDMNRCDRFTEQPQPNRIDQVHPGQLHAVQTCVRQNSLQEQLAAIGVLPLVAVEGHVNQVQPKNDTQCDDR
jgi:hypothetical protein